MVNEQGVVIVVSDMYTFILIGIEIPCHDGHKSCSIRQTSADSVNYFHLICCFMKDEIQIGRAVLSGHVKFNSAYLGRFCRRVYNTLNQLFIHVNICFPMTGNIMRQVTFLSCSV